MLDIHTTTSKLSSRTSQLWMRSLLSMNHDLYSEHGRVNIGPGLSEGEKQLACSYVADLDWITELSAMIIVCHHYMWL